MKKRKMILVLVCMMLLSGCQANVASTGTDSAGTIESTTSAGEAANESTIEANDEATIESSTESQIPDTPERSYQQEVNEQGIALDLLDNPYFMTKLDGYEYAEPEEITYYSNITDSQRTAKVLLPVDYDESKQYPVLYLLHGWMGDEDAWLDKEADIIIQNAFYLNDVPQMIAVFPNENLNAENNVDDLDYIESSHIYDQTPTELVENLMPYINEHYSTYTDREHTAVIGNSLGGKESLYTAFSHQDRFAYVASLACTSPIPDPVGEDWAPVMDDLTIDEGSEGFRLILINCGYDDPYIRGTEVVDEALTRNHIPHITYYMEGEHDNNVWRNGLYNFLQKIFRTEA